ncbi:MAG: bifunctional nuclease family protein [Anaerolineales bacterium]
MSPQRLVILRQVDAERYLPIWVGPYEAEAISVALQQIEMARPLTHDLLRNLLGIFNASLRRVEIVSLRDDIFYAVIVLESQGRTLEVDARPSDAIALAVRAHVPLLVDAELMKSAAVSPEQDLRASLSPAADQTESAPKTDDPARLSIFEDFLTKLDKKKPGEADDAPPAE